VKCTGPDASYACVVGKASNPTLDAVSKFYCITSLAKSGSHASCSIDRSMAPPCSGERRELPIPAFLNADAPEEAPPAQRQTDLQPPEQKPGPAVSPAETGSAGAAQQPKPPEGGEPPPKTVQEMVEKSAKSAGAGINETQHSAGEAAKSASTALEKAGSAVGGVAKSSWKCLSSFFSKC
jgi:hypothetical protein